MNPIISIHNWVSLPNELRYKIRAIFDIPRSSNTVVNDGVIETDGTTNEDFKHLTVEKMQVYLGTDSTDFHKLFDMVVSKINDEINPKIIDEKKESEPVKRQNTKRDSVKAGRRA